MVKLLREKKDVAAPCFIYSLTHETLFSTRSNQTLLDIGDVTVNKT